MRSQNTHKPPRAGRTHTHRWRRRPRRPRPRRAPGHTRSSSAPLRTRERGGWTSAWWAQHLIVVAAGGACPLLRPVRSRVSMLQGLLPPHSDDSPGATCLVSSSRHWSARFAGITSSVVFMGHGSAPDAGSDSGAATQSAARGGRRGRAAKGFFQSAPGWPRSLRLPLVHAPVNVAPQGGSPAGAGCASTSISICSVLPRPMSSHRKPPLQRRQGAGVAAALV